MPKVVQWIPTEPECTVTFLEYVLYCLCGPPVSTKGDGDSHWPCPSCGHRSFHTLPHMDGMKDRANCFRCGFRGDEADMRKHFVPHEGWPARRAWLADRYADYQRGIMPDDASERRPAVGQARSYSTPGTGMKRATQANACKVAQAWANLTGEEREAVVAALNVAKREAVPLVDLAAYCLSFVEFKQLSDDLDRVHEERKMDERQRRCEAVENRLERLRQEKRAKSSCNGRNGKSGA